MSTGELAFIDFQLKSRCYHPLGFKADTINHESTENNSISAINIFENDCIDASVLLKAGYFKPLFLFRKSILRLIARNVYKIAKSRCI
jgi:hypothetical protein